MILEKTLEEAMRSRSSCGFLLVAIDNLGRINDSYGFDIADEVIGAVAVDVAATLYANTFAGAGGIYASHDRGQTWSPLGLVAGSDGALYLSTSNRGTTSAAADDDRLLRVTTGP